MTSIVDEITCYATCIADSNLLPLILLLIAAAAVLLISYLKSRRPHFRIISFTGFQLSMLGTIVAIFSTMDCDWMLTLEIYIAYAAISTPIMLFLPRVYHRVLIRRYASRPLDEIFDWPQDFVNGLIDGIKLYYFDSAMPRAFASGKGIFISVGMLELLDDRELMAVLAHEVWHLLNNNKTSLLKQLSILTFTGHGSRQELELLADRFAENIVGRDAVTSARSKLE